jgi:hypothetical protein
VDDGTVIEHNFQSWLSLAEIRKSGPLSHAVPLYSSADQPPPLYDGEPGNHRIRTFQLTAKGMKLLVTVKGDLRKLPKTAFKEVKGPKGKICRVSYNLGIHFGAGGMDFRFIYNKEVLGEAKAEYS